MSKEIINAAIEKAHQNGLKTSRFDLWFNTPRGAGVIFDHDFAKALWGVSW